MVNWSSSAAAGDFLRSNATVTNQLNLKADRQSYDSRLNITIAEGNASMQLGNEAELQADRIEFNSKFRTLFAHGSVRLRRRNQYFQASSLRYNLLQGEGELDDVYGVIKFEAPSDRAKNTVENPVTNQVSPRLVARYNKAVQRNTAQESPTSLACPPLLPSVQDWYTQPWALTAWGGQLVDAFLGDTVLFSENIRPGIFIGVGVQKRIFRTGPFALKIGADFFRHIAKQQTGGEGNQNYPYGDLSVQSFREGVLSIGAHLWVQPWLSLGLIGEAGYGVNQSLYGYTHRDNYSHLFNRLGFELEATVSSDISLVGRIKHQARVFGTDKDVTTGGNAYLLGLRYRWGQDFPTTNFAEMPPPEGCPDPDRAERAYPSSLLERLESITLGDRDNLQGHVPKPKDPKSLAILPSEQQAQRTAAIKKIDQRVSNVELTGNFFIERRGGIPIGHRNSSIGEESHIGVVKLPHSGNLNRIITRWRFQANRVRVTAKGWQADRMSFSNDPFTPAQFRIDAEGVVTRERPNGDLLISTQRNRLIIDERFPIPVIRSQLIQKEKEVENRWVVGIDDNDRDGLFVGRTLQTLMIGDNTELSLQPQLLLQRAVNSNGKNIYNVFGLEAKLKSLIGDYRLNAEVDISSLNGNFLLDGSRYWADFARKINLGLFGEIKANLFSAYRYRTWNGSLGETDIQAAYGLYGEKSGEWSQDGIVDIRHRYLVRGAVGDYYAAAADGYNEDRMLRSGRASLFASLSSNFHLWQGKAAKLTPMEAYRYSPVAIIPGLSFTTNINGAVMIYRRDAHQKNLGLSGGPSVTIGTFSKPFLDFTRISAIGGITLSNGVSPFQFDRIIDFRTLGFGITQQIVGPLILSTWINVNIDPGSQYYGKIIDSDLELRWQRRSYDIGAYFNPYEGTSGVRFRLNDFNFKGTGVPFIPYYPTDQLDRGNGN
ncbi:DUF3769 domain-containing protein [Synechococcus sp. M16CYN]